MMHGTCIIPSSRHQTCVCFALIVGKLLLDNIHVSATCVCCLRPHLIVQLMATLVSKTCIHIGIYLTCRYNNGRFYLLVDGPAAIAPWKMTRNQDLNVLHVDDAKQWAAPLDAKVVTGDTLIFDFVYFLHPVSQLTRKIRTLYAVCYLFHCLRHSTRGILHSALCWSHAHWFDSKRSANVCCICASCMFAHFTRRFSTCCCMLSACSI